MTIARATDEVDKNATPLQCQALKVKSDTNLNNQFQAESPAVAIWITLQLGFAVICCNLPTYRPLLPYLTKLFPWSVTARAPSSHLSFKFARTKDSGNRGAKHNILDPKRSMDDTVPGYDSGRSSHGLSLRYILTKAVGGSDIVRAGGNRKDHLPGNAVEATTMEMV